MIVRGADRSLRLAALPLLLAMAASGGTGASASGQAKDSPQLEGPAPLLTGTAAEVRRFPAEEAKQGIAADDRYIYVNANSEIGKYEKKSGRRVAVWKGDPAEFIHMNSCAIVARELVCAASNYPSVPMASSVEYFDPRSMRHLRTRSLGVGRGSLTWLDWHQGSWWALFANYDNKGGEPGRDHRYTSLVRFDPQFREQGSWLFPQSVLQRLRPYSSSGGAWGKDGQLYVTGHDRREAYVLTLPKAGSTLKHVFTVALTTDGQAIAWDPLEPRLLWSVDRSGRNAVAASIPPLPRLD